MRWLLEDLDGDNVCCDDAIDDPDHRGSNQHTGDDDGSDECRNVGLVGEHLLRHCRARSHRADPAADRPSDHR